MFNKESEDNLFGAEEESIISKTRKIRLDLIDDMVDGGMPQRSGDIRVLNETLDALDRQVLDVTKIKAKQKEDDGNNKTILMVTELLSRVQQGKPQVIPNREIDLPDDYIPADIVPGETDIGPEQLELKNFMDGETDEFSN